MADKEVLLDAREIVFILCPVHRIEAKRFLVNMRVGRARHRRNIIAQVSVLVPGWAISWVFCWRQPETIDLVTNQSLTLADAPLPRGGAWGAANTIKTVVGGGSNTLRGLILFKQGV